jgi:hypothetical protein
VPNGYNIFQMTIKYTNFFHSMALKNLPKFGFLVWKTCHLATLARGFGGKFIIYLSAAVAGSERNQITDFSREFFGIVIRPQNRVARCFFKPKIQIWVNLRGSCKWKMFVYFIYSWSFSRSLVISYGHLV